MAVSNENRPRPRFRSSYDHLVPGVRYMFTPPNPAAGVDWSAAVPEGRSWRLRAGQAFFQASGAVANRQLGFQILWQGFTIWATLNTVNVAAGVGQLMVIQEIQTPTTAVTANARHWVDCPDFWLPGGTVLSAFNSNIQAGDQWSAIGLFIEESWGSDSDIEVRHELEELELAQLMAGGASLTTGG